MLTATIQMYRVATATQPMVTIMRQKMVTWWPEDLNGPERTMFRNILTGLESSKQRMRLNFGNLLKSWILDRYASALLVYEPTHHTVMLLNELLMSPPTEFDLIRDHIRLYGNGWRQTLQTSLTAGKCAARSPNRN